MRSITGTLKATMHDRDRAEWSANLPMDALKGKSILGHDDSTHDAEYMWLWGDDDLMQHRRAGSKLSQADY